MTKATTKSTTDKPKRVKVTLACVICRKKKVKCDGNKPACSRCIVMGIPCEFSDPPRKRGPPKNNIEVIESRANRIVSLLGNKEGPYPRPRPSSQQPQQQRNSNNNSLLPSSSSCTSSSSCPSSTPSPSPTPPSSPYRPSYQLISSNALLNLVTGAVEALKEKWRADSLLTGGPMTSLVNDNLPQRFKLQLAEKYFANFNLFLPILSRHHFLHQLVHKPDEMDRLLCYAVCAMGSRYLEHRDDMERLYFERCLLLFDKLKQDEPTIASVQGVIIMCWYTFMMGDFKKCACLRRHLIDYVRRLNLGKNADPSLSIVQTEQRRRTFWVIYVTDAWLAFYTDSRLINMTKEGWDCKKPILEDSQLQAIDSRNLKWQVEQPPVLQDDTTEAALQIPSFVELIQLASIVGDMFDCLHHPSEQQHRSTCEHLESQLNDWFRHLPSYLELKTDKHKNDNDNDNDDDEDNNSPAPIAKTIRILYHTVQIMMHQSSLLDYYDPQTRHTVCNNAADAIIHIAGQMLQQQDELKLYNTFAMSITLATSVHLEALMAETAVTATTTATTTMPMEIQEDQETSAQHGNQTGIKTRLGRSIRVLKDANCSYLTRVDFDRLVDRFLTNRCGLVMDDGFKSSHQLAGMWQILSRSRQSMTPEQQRQFMANHQLPHLGNGGAFGPTSSSPMYPIKSTAGLIEPVILSESLLSSSLHPSTNVHNLDIDGLLNDSMTDLIFGATSGGGEIFDAIPSASWAEYVSNNHAPLPSSNLPSSSSTKNDPLVQQQQQQQQHQQQQHHQQQQQQQQTVQYQHQPHEMDSSGSSASPPGYSPAYSPEEDNRIRLFPASTLLTSQHISNHPTEQQHRLHESDSKALGNGFIL